MTFCTDVDLIHWEPNLLKEAEFASQTLVTASGDLAGTTLTAAGVSFTDLQVDSGQVVYIGGSINGSFPIVAVASATELTLSVLYDKLYDETPLPARDGPDAMGVAFAIRTFWPQREVVTQLILHAAGLQADEFAKILNPSALKRACVLGTLQMIHSALAAAAVEATHHAARAALYERLYRRALRSTRVEIDLDGDGIADTVRALNTIRLVRI